ncbi:hypothetical protein E4U53_006912, partial [Claviceps sorghi]
MRTACLVLGSAAGAAGQALLRLAAGGGGARGEAAGAQAPLECLEVAAPVLSPRGLVDGADLVGEPARVAVEGESCVVTLMEHVFANSYGKPFV